MQFYQKTYRKSHYIHSSRLLMQPYLLSCTKNQQNLQPERLTSPPPLLAPPSLLTLSTKPSSPPLPLLLISHLSSPKNDDPQLLLPAGNCQGGPNLTLTITTTKTTAATSFPCSRHTLQVSFPRPFCPPADCAVAFFSAADGFVALWLSGFWIFFVTVGV